MKKITTFFSFLLCCWQSFAQAPVPMASQPDLTYTENFADISNWTNNFTSGIGANRYAAVPILNSGTIPSATRTTVSTIAFSTGGSGGVQKGTGNILLLSTGTTDNTSAAAFDLLIDFTTVNAGTLSFDWASVNNSSGDRKGSMHVYASTDGTTFTELSAAAVLNFTNNLPTSGSVSNVALPASFNLSPTAVLRFYYHNGTGGTTGSRPKISIDNITITATPTIPCNTPAAQPTSLIFGATDDQSIQGSFSASSPAADKYLVVASTNTSLTSNPVDGQVYFPGDGLGDGFVVQNAHLTDFTASGLAASTNYYFFIFAENALCTGGPLYLMTGPLTSNTATTSGLPPCSPPASQATNLQFTGTTVNTISGSFTATAASEYLVLRSTASSLSSTPVNGQLYSPNDVIGNAVVVQQNAATTFTATGLSPNTAYYFFIFSSNSQNCINGPAYNIVSALNGMQVTPPLSPCTIPSTQPTVLILNATNNSITGSFNAAASADDYLVIRSTSATLSSAPVNNTDYAVGNSIGGGTVIANTSLTNFTTAGLTQGTTYYFYIFAANRNCTGGTKYLTANPLKSNITTTSIIPNNYYFGNLHAHSDYSDGNKDNPGYTPADDYNYAMTSQCMDFLGISEHNHYTSPGNPGNKISNYHLGSSQANSFTAAHPNFLAMYGMEWGVISGGGHVLVYGDGMDNLFGWESGNGGWGPTNNYDIYVPKSVYKGSTGLFKVINDNASTNTFGSLAHPNSSDYDNLANAAYDAAADDAIVATAVESGPATSTNSTYSNPGSSMSYLWYYQTLLSKGYHLGPAIDHDNHYTTFGHTTYSRTAVIAPSLTKTEIIKAIRNMHFYATQDCDSKVDFSINSQIMGSVFTARYAPSITVNISDATTVTTGAVINIMFGVPGSGTLPVKITSATGSNLTYVDNNLPNLSTGYYYADITYNGNRIITSPIWYTRNDFVVLPVTLSSFRVKKLANDVQLNWSTSQEINSDHFVIERSSDGYGWNSIAAVAASGNSSTERNYEAFDNNPANGINYYRLRQVDRDGSARYSEVKNVSFSRPFVITVTPNPATSFINVSIINGNSGIYSIELTDINGRKLLNEKTGSSTIQLNSSRLASGLYFIKVFNGTDTIVEKVLLK